MILAEAISIDGRLIALLLTLFLLVWVAWVTLVCFGFKLARQAGEGDDRARQWWAVVVVLEVVMLLVSPFLLPLGLVAAGLQLWRYRRVRAARTAPPPPAGPPPPSGPPPAARPAAPPPWPSSEPPPA